MTKPIVWTVIIDDLRAQIFYDLRGMTSDFVLRAPGQGVRDVLSKITTAKNNADVKKIAATYRTDGAQQDNAAFVATLAQHIGLGLKTAAFDHLALFAQAPMLAQVLVVLPSTVIDRIILTHPPPVGLSDITTLRAFVSQALVAGGPVSGVSTRTTVQKAADDPL